ncbi:MAG: ribosome assembly cofactor RimP [Bacteroidales bacterium]|nr:ribosome assembly cofactor RimP [Bacteroidales bacterium]HQP02961.1 ribosome assembly cofactor RimP [Bacteroidales bacterium]
MIEKKDIEKLATGFLGETQFLVDVQVTQGNAIRVFVDDMNGLDIDACKLLSRKIESALNRDVEDFELEVSSPGLGKAFKVMQQYVKCTGKMLEVTLKNGIKTEGILREVNAENIILETIRKKTKKDPAPVPEATSILFSEIKTANEKLIF